MRVAFVGKGGAGKSNIAGTFARLLARRGEPVLALDSDPMPGLAYALGLAVDDAGIPDEAVEENPDGEGPRYRLRADLSVAAAVERYATTAPDGVRFLQFGKLRDHASTLMRSQFAYRQITRELVASTWHLVGDLPAGTRQAFFGWGDYADTVVVVVEPSAKSVLSARRLARLALAKDAPTVVAVVNKARENDDAAVVAARTGLDVIACVPYDDTAPAADRAGAAPIDHAPTSDLVTGVQTLLDRLLDPA
jgi:CO dehydrogenase maturation factor